MARPTIRTHADPGTASVSDASELAITSKVVTRPNGVPGEHVASSGEGPLVKDLRRDNG